MAESDGLNFTKKQLNDLKVTLANNITSAPKPASGGQMLIGGSRVPAWGTPIFISDDEDENLLDWDTLMRDAADAAQDLSGIERVEALVMIASEVREQRANELQLTDYIRRELEGMSDATE